jgi:hypothetical protein
MKLVRPALREPKDGALEAREAKFIYVALAPALCRTGVGMKQFLECCAGIDIGNFATVLARRTRIFVYAIQARR